MSEYKIVTLCGPDNIGKTTQAKLLSNALQPSKQLAFPDNDHWSGQVIRTILAGEPFSIRRYTTAPDPPLIQEAKEAISFQYLQAINRLTWKDRIAKGLRIHHWIMDRYDVDAIAYGCAEGTPLDLTLQMIAQDIPSDVIVILDGNGFRAPGGYLDRNDADTGLQSRVRRVYNAYFNLYPKKCIWVNVDALSNITASFQEKLHVVHGAICRSVGEHLGQTIIPLRLREIPILLGIP